MIKKEKSTNLRVLDFHDRFYPHSSESLKDNDLAGWIRCWKKSIISVICEELGKKIGIKEIFNSDANILMELAENEGLRKKGIIKYLFERVKIDPVKIEIPLTESQLGLLQRAAENNGYIWVFIDDIDSNFDMSERTLTSIAAFYCACRKIVYDIPELRVRTTIRPNVWKVISSRFDPLSKVRQYLFPITWTVNDLEELLAKRIQHYTLNSSYSVSQKSNSDIINSLFTGDYDLGEGSRPPITVLSKLAKMRPRWLIELGKSSCNSAKREKRNSILDSDVKKSMNTFGENRIIDFCAEYHSICPNLRDLIELFRYGPVRYKNADLNNLYKSNSSRIEKIKIIGHSGKITLTEISDFLYFIGFLDIRKDLETDGYDIFSFEDSSTAPRNLKIEAQGYWELHPCFRDVLRAGGTEFTPSRSAKRRNK